MKTLERAGLLAFAVLSSGLAGCASSRPGLTEAQLKPYVALAPFDFVRRRFFDEQLTPTQDGLESAAKRYADFMAKLSVQTPPAPNLSERKPEISAELNLVTWPAYFTDVNWRALVRPAAELASFCRARGGEWAVVESYLDDPVASLRRDPMEAYLDAHARVMRSLTARRAYAGFEEVRSVMAENVGREMAEEAQWANRRIDKVFSTEGFRYAQRSGAMGLYQCKEAQGRTWWVSVVPATLVGRSKDVSTSMARLSIRVFEPAQRTPTSALKG